ncbi:type II toxin-antitoxin system PemK/MazF family toxin [Halorussus salinus]|uniref:type II toxin-antitoxin system PemK/MazF family toxin n=1 Tax=Halorussus salinus TaxID=1364935 RepID=UPI001091F453
MARSPVQGSNRRPFVVVSDDSRPFHGEEYTVVALTTSPKDETIPLDSSDWLFGEMDEQSHASPWFAFTVKHSRIVAPQGSLTEDATDRIARAAARNFGLQAEG